MRIFGLPPENEMEVIGNDMRFVAASDPCYSAMEGADPKYYRMIGGRFHASICLELFQSHIKGCNTPPPPCWHCSVNVLHDLVSGDDKSFGMPQQGILRPELWNADDKKDSKEIMGYLFAPVLVEKTQPVIEIAGLMSMHWYTPADSRYAKTLSQQPSQYRQ